MRACIILILFFVLFIETYSQFNDPEPHYLAKELTDTTNNFNSQDSLNKLHRVNVDIILGRQFFSGKWNPYSNSKILIGASAQVKLGISPYWIDGSIIVAFAGETDAEGYPAGPGSNFVEFHNGLMFRYHPEELPFSFFAGLGLTYIWANLELPDQSGSTLPISEYLNRSVYPGKREEGHFWGGYIRGGMVYHPVKGWYLGFGVFGIITTNRILLDRNLNINSTMISLLFGVEG